MNIFILDYDLEKNAKYHNDKHLVKMILEQTQLLMSAYYFSESHKNIILEMKKHGLYNLTHSNHPSSIWVRESIVNWRWLYQSTFCLNNEWQARFDKKDLHKSLMKINLIVNKFGEPDFKNIGLSDFPQVMPDKYKEEDTVLAYRNYYINEKQHIAKWKNKKPYWWKDLK